jgi:hypothetical protein
MAGPATHVDYHSDNGTTYRILKPNWQNTIASNAAATSTNTKPAGLRPRYRMLQDPSTGREHKVTVCQITSTAWTAGLGASAGNIVVADGSTVTGALYMGRIGERQLSRG